MEGQPIHVAWTSLLPPLVSIALAVLARQVLVALLCGVWLGAYLALDVDPFTAFLRAADTYLLAALADRGHAAILLFSLMLGGLIGLVRGSGGGVGLASVVTRLATNPVRGQLSAWLLGIVMFFDDYASTLLVGSSLRPVIDRLRISRAKLAFIADSTGASISSVAVASSWIGVELGYIADQVKALELDTDAYSLFVESLPYRFYPWLMLTFGLFVALRGRDFGPMLAAERRARAGGASTAESERKEPEREGHWVHAAVPVGVAVTTILIGMLVTGRDALDAKPDTLANILSGADAPRALIWGSLLGGVSGAVLALATRTLSLAETTEAWLDGARSVALAMMVLVCAWALGALCRELHTAEFLVSALGENLDAALVPALVFVVSAVTSFATGTSWGTMGILFPLAVPLSHTLSGADHEIVVSTIASVLAGSVWGDHCSPISDTTIMSSMAAGCEHMEHVRTQLPYALVVGVVSVVLGDLATGMGLYGPFVGLALGMALLWAVVELKGKPVAST